MKCIGIIGFLFGHKYEPVFDEDSEGYSSEEMKIILAETIEYNRNVSFSREIFPPVNKTKRKTKVYQGHICTRCGDFKKQV
jgi:hypothetical protein